MLRGTATVIKRASVTTVIVLAVVACTAAPASSPTIAPTASPEATATPVPVTPSPSPTAEPTASPTDPPTPSPTAEPTASPTDPPTPSPTAEPTGPSAVELFLDDMSDPQSGWGVAEGERGRVAYADGALQLDTVFAGAYVWSTRPLTSAWDVLRVEGLVVADPEGTGYLGLMCANESAETLGALVTSAGGWVFIRIESDAVSVLDFDLDAGLELGEDFLQLTLDCVHTSFSAILTLHVNGSRVASHETEQTVGSFAAVGVYAEAESEQFTVYFDGVRAVGATDASALPPVTSADVDVLLESVPEAFRERCEETAVSMFEPGAIVAVSCSLGEEDADVVEYVQFDSTESMEAAYQQRVASYASDVTGTTCSVGPSELAYDIGGQEAGRLFCAPQTVGIRLDWTDTRLNILSSIIDYDAGSEGYPGLFQVWLLAGPDLPSGEI
jgi:hypothetical protein